MSDAGQHPTGPARTKLLYISSVGRSGTTLLSKILGQVPNVCDVGELWALWRPAFATGTCGCGLAVRECPFWLSVVKSALGEGYEEEGPAVGRLHRDHLGTRRVPRVWLHTSGLHRDPAYDAYGTALGRHYAAIAEVSGARVIVDCSCMPGDAIVASTLPGVDLYVLHLVRDPRGVAYSWSKDLDLTGNMGAHGQVHTAQAAATRWLLNNAYVSALVRPHVGDRFAVLRYEDLVADPRAVLEGLVEWVGEGGAALPMGERPDEVVLASTHSVFGNRIRLRTGPLQLRLDEEWRRAMSRRDQAVVSALSLPYLGRFGYPVNPSGPRRVRPRGR
ncbi:MAG TPA: sulfotransferase [Acidimicrobiales bacterium]|nr:sulfotransferase [Acidimicrobiales bacterium]